MITALWTFVGMLYRRFLLLAPWVESFQVS